MELLQRTTLAGQDISTASIGCNYTATGDSEILCAIYLSGISGAGVYKVLTTKTPSALGVSYQSPTAAVGVSAGTTTLYLESDSIAMLVGDVVKVYIEGLETDTAVDIIVELYDITAADVSSLSTTLHLQEVEDKVDIVQAKTDQLAFTVPNQVDANALAGGGGATAQDVWEYSTRELTSGANIDLSGLALESTLTAMKGAGWTTETLKSIKEAISLIPEGITIQDLKDIVIEGDFTFYDLLKVIPAALAGKLNGGGTGTLHFRNLMDTLDRITAEVDLETGDRTSITLDLT